MPQVQINSVNIVDFRFSMKLDIYNKTMLFTDLSTYTSGGNLNVLGISFQVKDASGVVYKDFDFSAPDIDPAASQTEYTFDWSAYGLPFILGNTLIITGGIKDADATITHTPAAYKTICKPNELTESGYVPGKFQLLSDCVNNVLTVKEGTVLIYNKLLPTTVTKSGNLYYPTGAGVTVAFTNTPFSNNLIVTGQSRIECTTVAIYDLGDDIYVLVTYLTKANFDINCSNFLGDISCCLSNLQQTYLQHCNDAIGENAKQQSYEVLPSLVLGMLKQISGQDASKEVAFIKKTLNCDCGVSSLVQNEMTPTNPSVTSIVLVGSCGNIIPDPAINGNTKTYTIPLKNYAIVKTNTLDLAFTLTTDTTDPCNVKYKIQFNYDVQAGYILTAIGENPALVSQLNSLITSSGEVNLSGLSADCIGIDLAVNLVLTQNVNSNTLVTTLVGAFDHSAPPNLFATNAVGIQTWLNTLSLGTFTVSYNSGVLTILSLNNNNAVVALVFTNPDTTVYFQKTNKTIVQVLQAIIDYLCALTACQVALCQALTLYYFDYAGDLTSVNFTGENSQNDYNVGLQNVINNLAARIDELTGITCAKIQAIFPDRPLSNVLRLYGSNQDGDCTAFTQEQLGLAVVQSIESYPTVKNAFCAIECGTPADCPDITDTSLAMSGTDIGFYGLTWNNAPGGVQTITLYYKLSSSPTWLVSTNALQILPNGNLVGNTPYLITGVTAGETYDVKAVNNCGGVGFSKQITTPTGTVYPGEYLVDDIIYDVCGNSPTTLYSSQPFGIGTFMFNDSALTVPTTGYNYIVDTSGQIYTIDPATGEVLSDTGNNCGFGTANKIILGNNTGSLCGGIVLTLYTSGPFAVGKVLYTDSGLTSPATGSSYAGYILNSHIYTVNSVTGQVMADSGLTCGSYSGTFRRDNSDLSVCAASTETLYSSSPFNTGVIMYTDSGLTIPATGEAFIVDEASGLIYGINAATGQVGVQTGSCL